MRPCLWLKNTGGLIIGVRQIVPMLAQLVLLTGSPALVLRQIAMAFRLQ